MSNLKHQLADLPRTAFLGGQGGKESRVIELDIGTDNLGAGDKWEFLKLPADSVVESVYLATDDLDGATALTLNIKVLDEAGNGAATLLSASDVGQAGGVVAAGSNLPVLTKAVPFYVFVDVEAAATTAQAGKARLVVTYCRTRG